MFVNTNLFTIVKKSDFPDKDSIYFEQYWDKMHELCMNGYSVGGLKITGRHFWYLNFWPIYGLNKKTGRKELIRPRFTELDYERHLIIDRMYKEEKDLMWVKGRQNGSSESVAGSGIGYDFTFYPKSQSVIVAGEEKYSEHTMINVKRGLDKLVDTEFYKERTPNSLKYIQAMYTIIKINEEGKKTRFTGGYLSEVYARTALNNPQVVSGLSPTLIIYEESGAWKKHMLRETRAFVEPSLRTEGVKTGYAIFISTGGEQGDSVEDVEYMFYNPDEFNLLTFDNSQYDDDSLSLKGSKQAYFIPAWKFEVMDDEGNIDKEKSIKSLKIERKKKKGKELQRYITQKPFTPEEAFMISSGGYFDEDVVNILNERRAYIMKHRELRDFGRRLKLYWKMHDGDELEFMGKRRNDVVDVVYKDDPEGDCTIYEMPYKEQDKVPILLYKGATDSYDRDEANTSDSRGSTGIMKGFINMNETSNLFVAEINIRPRMAEMFYEKTAQLMWLYNARNLIEYSNLRIFDWYTINGFEYMLRERPYLAQASFIKDSKVFNRYGVDPMLKYPALAKLADWLKYKENVDKLMSLEQINAFIKFRLDRNCDITMRSAWQLLHLTEDDGLQLNYRKDTEVNKSDTWISYGSKQGKLVII